MKRSYIKVILQHVVMGFAVLFVLIPLQGPLLSSAQAALINNGGFMPPPNTTFITVNAVDSLTIPGWTVTQGSVDWIGTYWQAPLSSGQASIDLDGNSPGAISQTLSTTPGQSYIVTFYLSGNPDGGPSTKQLAVSATGNPTGEFTYTMDNNSETDMKYLTESYGFTAAGPSTILSFTSLDSAGNAFGPVIGNVAAAPVPLPSALLLFAPGLLGLIGIKRRC